MGFFDDLFHPGKGYDKAQEQLNQYYNQGQGALNPYMQQGQQAYGQLSGAMGNLLDPAKLQAEWAKSYSMSPQAQQAQDMAQQQGLDAASSMGLLGSRTGLDAIQAGTSAIGAADRQKYLDDLMQKYTLGTGIGQNMYNTGANAAGQQSQNAMNMGQNSAQMAYGSQNAGNSMFGNLLGGLGTIAGGVLGGPIGGALANKLSPGWNLTGGK